VCACVSPLARAGTFRRASPHPSSDEAGDRDGNSAGTHPQTLTSSGEVNTLLALISRQRLSTVSLLIRLSFPLPYLFLTSFVVACHYPNDYDDTPAFPCLHALLACEYSFPLHPYLSYVRLSVCCSSPSAFLPPFEQTQADGRAGSRARQAGA